MPVLNSSRFAYTPSTIFDGQFTYGRWVLPSFLAKALSPTDVRSLLVTPELEGKPHAIALEVYGDEELEWIIIAYNATLDVINWPAAGETIKYPAPGVVLPILG